MSLFLLKCFSVNGEELTFNKDIRPILSENCFFCHGFDKEKRKADLRLDTFEGATEKRKGGAAIIPGDSKNSLLVERIETHDQDELMPPPDSIYFLNKEQKQKLKKWIDQGAKYEEHWAYVPLKKKTSKSIDQFIAEVHAENDLKPVEAASSRTLIRRLSQDLKGLPPTLEEVQKFKENPSDKNYEAVVDKYLSSFEHAENQALQWLDLVRWANTSGLVSDEPIASEAYRNYVVQSVYENLPFDTFTIEQLAGDLIPNKTNRSLIASGYNRILKTNCEMGVIEEEALYAMKGEHVRSLGTVWLGLTTGCAECHDHKYDPIQQKDYYNFAAFFDDLVETGVYTCGDRRIPLHYVYDSAKTQTQDQKLYDKLQLKYHELYTKTNEIDQTDFQTWQSDQVSVLKEKENQKDYLWLPANLPAGLEQSGHYKLVTSSKEGLVRKVKAKRNEVLRHDIAEVLTGYITKKESDYFVEVKVSKKNTPKWIAVQTLHGDYGRLGWEAAEKSTFIWGEKPDAYFKENQQARSKNIFHVGELPKLDEWVRLKLPSEVLKKGSKYEAVGMAWLQKEGEVLWGDSGISVSESEYTNYVLGQTGMRKFLETPHTRNDYQNRFQWPAKIIQKAAESRTKIERELMDRAYVEAKNPRLLKQIQQMERELYRLRKGAQEVLVSKAGVPKVTHVLPRGDFMDLSGPKAIPAIPEYFGTLKTDGKRATRLDLAHWLVSKDNPLVARVFVNRLWNQFFGQGLSTTLEDIGTQGNWPSHPELIDNLAKDFIDSGWNVRHVIKKIVLSNTYKLSSKPMLEQAESDPSNRLLTHQNRFRLHAEAIRDHALDISGLLVKNKTVPRGNYFYHQPKAYWDLSNKVMFGSRHMKWHTSQGSEQYQRSLYGYYKRQNAHPTLLAFDAPTRQECSTKRVITNTPAQALTLLNDPIFMDAAKALSDKLGEVKGLTQNEKVERLFQWSLNRKVRDTELSSMLKLYQSQLALYRENPEDTRSLFGLTSKETLSKEHYQRAAWVTLSRVVMNLHETINRL